MDTSALIKAIDHASTASADIPDMQRKELLVACGKLQGALETPYETTLRLLFTAPQSVMLRLGVDMKLFDFAAEETKKGNELTVENLAAQMGAEVLFVRRLMRILSGMGVFKEIGLDTYVSTPLAAAYVTGSPFAFAIIHMTSEVAVVFKLPEYFEENGFKCPNDGYHGPYQYAKNTPLHAFEWVAQRPRLQEAMNVVMTLPRQNRSQQWHEFFPVESKLQVDSNSDHLLVDVGGGVGHNLVAFKDFHPTLQGQLVLQDIPSVIDLAKDLPKGITAMKHNFFEPQPVKGAKAYYLANVLHDWPETQAHIILGHIKEAMAVDSILLISENVVPEEKVPLYSATVDWIMMSMFSALERTQKQFQTLLTDSGFKVVKVWAAPGAASGSERLFEAVIA